MIYVPSPARDGSPIDEAFDRIGKWFDVEFGGAAGLAVNSAVCLVALEDTPIDVDAVLSILASEAE